MSVAGPSAPSVPGTRRPPFERLGRRIVRHPWQIVLLWVVLLIAALPLLPKVGNATTTSSLSLASSTPSQQESTLAEKVFRNASAPSDTLILLQGPDITDATGRNATLGLTRALLDNQSLTELRAVDTLYTEYRSFLEEQVEVARGVLTPGVIGNASALAAIRFTGNLTWGTADLYVTIWKSLVNTSTPGTPASQENYPAYQDAQLWIQDEVEASEAPPALANLSLFYNGDPGAGNGFNGSGGCAAAPAAVVACAEGVVREVQGSEGPSPLEGLVLSTMDLWNFSFWPALQNTTLRYLSQTSGASMALLGEVWTAPQGLIANASALGPWANRTIGNGTVATYAPAVPPSIYQEFVSPGDNLSVVVVTFNSSDDGPQVAADVPLIDQITSLSLAATDPSGTISSLQTGDAALVVNEQNVINDDTALILPITILLLLGITALYFRAPLTPILVLLVIGVALVLGLAAMVILTTFTPRVTQTALTLLITFVLGVGTDYSVFLTARYREELRAGKPHQEALVTSVAWAGESIATSGSTVILATIAMTFSGTDLISDWGRVLALGVTLALLVALTLVPAFLALVGPRIFWPYTGARFKRQATRVERSFQEGNTYFHRASRFAYRRPAVVLGIVVLVSLPLIYLALTAPLSYAYFGQLPSDEPSAQGLQTLSGNFGPGYVFPLDVLVTFQSPLVGPGNVTNAGEFAQATYIASAMNATAGVHSVGSLVGTGGAPLSTWLSLSSAPPAEQALLLGTLAGYLGSDGRTLEYTVALTSNGNSNAAVSTMDAIESNLSAYHPSTSTISAIYYGGAPSETKDLQAQLSVSSDVMATIIVVGLLLILLLALGSAILPPRAVITIAMSVAWAWAITFVAFVYGLNLSLFFYIPPVLFLLVMGLGMDYDIFIMTRVREERLKGKDPETAVVDAVAHTAGIITAAAIILAGAFFALTFAHITLLRVLGFSVGAAILLDAAVIRTYLVPAILGVGGDKIWWTPRFLRWIRRSPADVPIRRQVGGPGQDDPAVVPGPSPPAPEGSESPG